MSWWRDHGGTVVMVAALWVVFNDPINRLLPVPMPELEPGPRTTWLAEVPFRDGRPNYAAAIDAVDAERLAAGADGRAALQTIMAESDAGVALTAYLLGLELGPAGKGTADQRLLIRVVTGDVTGFHPLDATQLEPWQARCDAALDTLLRLPPPPSWRCPPARWMLRNTG